MRSQQEFPFPKDSQWFPWYHQPGNQDRKSNKVPQGVLLTDFHLISRKACCPQVPQWFEDNRYRPQLWPEWAYTANRLFDQALQGLAAFLSLAGRRLFPPSRLLYIASPSSALLM